MLIQLEHGWITLPTTDARRLAGMLLDAADAVDELELRKIDPCPVCGVPVDQVDGGPGNGRHIARPCGHRVAVTMWPDRVELTRVLEG